MTASMGAVAPRLACDIGGTFTDFVVEDGGRLRLEKVLTTPADPAQGIFSGIRDCERADPGLLARTSTIVHGTTLVINALIERKGAPTALITTEGFRDVLDMRNGLRYDIYDLQLEYPAPLVPRAHRYEVPERVRADGRIVRALDEAAVRAVIARIVAANIESVAVCLIHGYANPAHEHRIAELLAQHAPGVSVSIASEVLPRIGEYQRTSTVVANAYVQPRVDAYIDRIDRGLAEGGFRGAFYVMHSAGGVMTGAVARQYPIHVLESGPAGGVAAAVWCGRQAGLADLLCFDMGGTTAKLCPVSGGEAIVTDEYEAGRVYRFKRGSGFAVNVPVLDLLEIGTGGGSIAGVDSLGLLKVGPTSAGAAPGPASYGFGATRPTVTDADLMLGYLDTSYFLGGTMPLYADLARDAIDRDVAGPLGLAPEQAAESIHQLSNENMAAAARLHLAELGVDPASLGLVAYGGAGPVHACGLAQRLGCNTVLIPPAAGVMSALGMLVADLAMERSRTLKVMLERLDDAGFDDAFRRLDAEFAEVLPRPAGGLPPVVAHSVDMRYFGQGYTVHVAVPPERAGGNAADWLRDAFRAVYRRLYGRTYDDVPIELITLRSVARVPAARAVELPTLVAADRPVVAARKGARRAWFGELGGFVDCPVFDRYLLRPGHEVHGPAIVEERETTSVVTPGSVAGVDRNGTLRIQIGIEQP